MKFLNLKYFTSHDVGAYRWEYLQTYPNCNVTALPIKTNKEKNICIDNEDICLLSILISSRSYSIRRVGLFVNIFKDNLKIKGALIQFYALLCFLIIKK